MKKMLALLLALVMIFSLAACGEGEKEPDEDKTEPTSASAEKTEPSETEPSESEVTEPTTEPAAPSESEATEPTTEPVAPSESEVTEPTTEPVAPSESEVTEPTTEPVAPSESETTDPTTEPTTPVVLPDNLDPDLIGTWSGSVTMDGAMMEMPELDATLTLDMTMAFASNGMCTMSLDRESLQEQLPAFLEAMIPVAVEAFYEEMGGEEAAEEAMMEMAGMTVTEYFESILNEETMDELIFGAMEETSMTAEYTIENGQIVIDGEGVTYAVEGDKLILTDEDLNDFGMESVELTRIDAADPDIPEISDDPEPPVEPGELDEALFGTWSGSVVADGAMMEMPDLDATLTVVLTMTFGEDGMCTLAIDEDALRVNLEDFLEAAIPYMVEMVYEEMGGKEAAEAEMMESMGMTVTEFYESFITVDMFMDIVLEAMGDTTSASMEYSVADGVLYMGEQTADYTVAGDTLTLSGGSLAEGLAEMGMESLELTKVG